MRKKRTEILIETTRVLVANGRGTRSERPCERCGEEVQMVTIDQTATVGGISAAAVRDWLDANQILFTEKSDGLVHVSACLNCLIKSILTVETLTRFRC